MAKCEVSRMLVSAVVALAAVGCRREITHTQKQAPSASTRLQAPMAPRTTVVREPNSADTSSPDDWPPIPQRKRPGCTPLDVIALFPPCMGGVSARDWLAVPDGKFACAGSKKVSSVEVRAARKGSNFVLSVDNRQVDTLCRRAGGIPALFTSKVIPLGTGIAYECWLPAGIVQGYVAAVSGVLHRWTWGLTGPSLFLRPQLTNVPLQLERFPEQVIESRSYAMPCTNTIRYKGHSASLSIYD